MKNVADVYHLTPVQRDVLTAAEPRVVQHRWRVDGELDSELFERAWQELLARHTMLRTCFLTGELKEPVQVVRQQVKLVYERYDLSEVEVRRRQAELEDLLRMDRQRVFDPARAPLFRVMEIRLGGRSFEVVLSHHPVLLDEWSVQLMKEEVFGGASSDLVSASPGVAPPYRDYVAWVERQDLSGARLYFTRSVQGEDSVGVVAHQRPKSLPQSERIVGLCASVLPCVEQETAKLQRYAHVSQSQIRQWTDLADDAKLFGDSICINPCSKNLAVADPLLDFSLFYFADDNATYGEDKYRLYREGALFADRNDLTAVWTPERHFHEKAGLYPNPSVLSAALATITKQVRLRAGSVVLPLHHSLRVAEEWSIVDNLSNGRAGISFTSGWMPNDFAFFPERYPTKRDEMFRGIEEVQRLWRGETIDGRDGLGKEIELRIFPKPINPELPIWLTCSGGPEMFEKAGELGFHVLTALLTQSIEEVTPKIQLYRDSLARHGHDPQSGKVTMMMHTFIGEDPEYVLQKVRAPLTKYLKSHLNLIETGAQSLNLEINIQEHDDRERYRDQMAAFAFERYYRTSSLIGTPTSCLKMIERLKAIGVDEVACLIDFGVDVDSVLESLEHLVVLRELSRGLQQEERVMVSTAAHV
jgi:natural product biosynthesis luciferase-like monooxygenase protein